MTSRTFAAVILAGVLAGTTVAAQRGPAAAAAHLPAEVLALACAPKAALEVPNTPLRITGGQDSSVRRSHAPGDIVTINAGSQNGIEVGQEYYTRRAADQQSREDNAGHAGDDRDLRMDSCLGR